MKTQHAALFGELRRHALSLNQGMIAEVILDLTLGWGLEAVAIPELTYFTSLTGIQKPHVTETIQRLHRARIIRIATVKDVRHYSINPNVDSWKVMPRTSLESIADTLSLLREINGLRSGGPVSAADPEYPLVPLDEEHQRLRGDQ